MAVLGATRVGAARQALRACGDSGAGRPDRGRWRARGALSNRCRGGVAGCATRRPSRSRPTASPRCAEQSVSGLGCGLRGGPRPVVATFADSRQLWRPSTVRDQTDGELTVAVPAESKATSSLLSRSHCHRSADVAIFDAGPRGLIARGTATNQDRDNREVTVAASSKIATAVSSRSPSHRIESHQLTTVAISGEETALSSRLSRSCGRAGGRREAVTVQRGRAALAAADAGDQDRRSWQSFTGRRKATGTQCGETTPGAALTARYFPSSRRHHHETAAGAGDTRRAAEPPRARRRPPTPTAHRPRDGTDAPTAPTHRRTDAPTHRKLDSHCCPGAMITAVRVQFSGGVRAAADRSCRYLPLYVPVIRARKGAAPDKPRGMPKRSSEEKRTPISLSGD